MSKYTKDISVLQANLQKKKKKENTKKFGEVRESSYRYVSFKNK